jgi:hypothetical protein
MTSNTPRDKARKASRYFRRLADAARERAVGARRAGNEAAAQDYDQEAASLDARAARIEREELGK